MDQLDIANMTPSQRETLMEKVRTEMAIANAQQILMKVNEKCLTQCLGKSPGTSLGNREKGCLSRCMDRYMDTYNIVLKAYRDRVTQGGVQFQ